jgi:hypothetical protein
MGLVMFFPRKAIAFEQVGVLSVDDAHSFAHLLLLAGSLGSDSIDQIKRTQPSNFNGV